MKQLGAAVCAVALAVGVCGCGYRTAGRTDRLPATLHTIAIPGFVNQTTTYRIEQVLTTAVVREFGNRTRFRVAHEKADAADATLNGTVTSTQLAPVTYDSETGRASSAIIIVNLRISLVDRGGKVLFENANYSFREQYQISREISSFFEEESPAIDRLSQEFARTLVSNILEAF